MRHIDIYMTRQVNWHQACCFKLLNRNLTVSFSTHEHNTIIDEAD